MLVTISCGQVRQRIGELCEFFFSTVLEVNYAAQVMTQVALRLRCSSLASDIMES